jgi:ferredoxin
MRVIVDKARCIAAGHCVVKSPSVFDQEEDTGLVILLNENPPESLVESVKLAARLCPASAITINEE